VNVPVLYLSDLFARREVRDLLSLIVLVAEGDGVGLMRVGAMPEHSLPRTERVKLIRFARERGERFPDALARSAEAQLTPKAVTVTADLLSVLRAIGWQVSPWQFLARYLFGHGLLVRRLLREETASAAQQLMALGQLLAVARAFTERPLGGERDAENTLRAFLIHVRRLVASDDNRVRLPPGSDELDAVRILTIHTAKGLEFPVVYVTNLATKRFPCRDLPDPVPPLPGLAEDDVDSRFREEACLFFVAISRAKQELVLSRANHYGKTDYAPSPPLEVVEPFFGAEPPERLHWTSQIQPTEETMETPASVPLDQKLDVSQVELYLRCPRRYEYRHVLHLREHDELLGYKRFQACVYRVLALLRTRHRNNDLPDAAAALTMLMEEWEQHGPHGHVFEELYRDLSRIVIERVWNRLNRHVPGQSWRDHLDVELTGATVRIQLDDAELASDGTIRISIVHLGRPRDADRKARRLAVLRAEAGRGVGSRKGLHRALLTR